MHLSSNNDFLLRHRVEILPFCTVNLRIWWRYFVFKAAECHQSNVCYPQISIPGKIFDIPFGIKLFKWNQLTMGKYFTSSSSSMSTNAMEQVAARFTPFTLIDVQMWCTHMRRIWSKQGRNWTIFGCFFLCSCSCSPSRLRVRLSCIIIIYYALYAFSTFIAWRQMFVSFCSASQKYHRTKAECARSHTHTFKNALCFFCFDVFVSATNSIEFMIFDALADF